MTVKAINESRRGPAGNTPDRPRIALLSDGNPLDRNTMSGTPYYCARALEEHYGSVVALQPGYEWVNSALRYANAPVERITGRRYSRSHSTVVAQLRGRRYSRSLPGTEADVVFSAKECKGVAYLRSKKPVIYWTDATFRCICGYYPDFSNLYSISRKEGELLERRALERADHVVLLSRWAADSVVNDYGIDPAKVSWFPFGPKLDQVPPRELATSRRITEPVELLLVGGSWQRKGGPIAVQTLKELRRRGINARLTVAGKAPPETAEGLEAAGYLDKNGRDGALGLNDLYRRAHFFLMPVRQEAGGSVFTEAAAHGLPVLACKTGGTDALVREGESGHLLPLEAGPSDFADLIEGYLNEPTRYEALVGTTRDFHEREANWATWAGRVGSIFDDLLRRNA